MRKWFHVVHIPRLRALMASTYILTRIIIWNWKIMWLLFLWMPKTFKRICIEWYIDCMFFLYIQYSKYLIKLCNLFQSYTSLLVWMLILIFFFQKHWYFFKRTYGEDVNIHSQCYFCKRVKKMDRFMYSIWCFDWSKCLYWGRSFNDFWCAR